VGMEPTSVRRKAEPTPRHSSWEVSTAEIENDIIDIYDMSSTLVALLQPHAKQIAAAKQQFKLDAVLEVVLWITTDDSKSTPAIGFDSNVISFLNMVSATIDIDTYRNSP
jgi:hypothetical protein